MTTIFKSPGVYTTETNSDYWLPPEVMKDIRQSGLSISRRMKVAKIFKDESLYPKMKDGPIDSNGPIGVAGISVNPS